MIIPTFVDISVETGKIFFPIILLINEDLPLE